MEEMYKGVKIEILPGIPTTRNGSFILTWPGHEETVKSSRYQAQYVLMEAKEFVDQWLEDGYIVIPQPIAEEK